MVVGCFGKTYEKCRRCGHYFVILNWQIANDSNRNKRRLDNIISMRKDICDSCAVVEDVLRWYKGNGEWDFPNKIRITANRSRYETGSHFPIEIEDIEQWEFDRERIKIIEDKKYGR